jgi:hypothetical protein
VLTGKHLCSQEESLAQEGLSTTLSATYFSCFLMRLGKFLTSVLALCVGFSACTGGIFAIPLALAAEVLTQDGAPYMSVASEDLYACLTFSPVQPEYLYSQGEDGGCRDAELCLQQAYQSGLERTGVLRTDMSAIIIAPSAALITQSDTAYLHIQPVYLARAGPLFAEAPMLANSLVKRE